APAAAAEGVADDRHVGTRLLHAHHPRAVGAIDGVARHRGVAAILRQEERPHPRAEYLVTGEDDVAALLHVHGVAACAELAAADADVLAGDEIDATLAGAGAERGVQGEEGAVVVVDQFRLRAELALEADGRATGL